MYIFSFMVSSPLSTKFCLLQHYNKWRYSPNFCLLILHTHLKQNVVYIRFYRARYLHYFVLSLGSFSTKMHKIHR